MRHQLNEAAKGTGFFKTEISSSGDRGKGKASGKGISKGFSKSKGKHTGQTPRSNTSIDARDALGPELSDIELGSAFKGVRPTHVCRRY